MADDSRSDEATAGGGRTPAELAAELERRGHVNTSWAELGSITLPVTDIETSQYRIGSPDDAAPPPPPRKRKRPLKGGLD